MKLQLRQVIIMEPLTKVPLGCYKVVAPGIPKVTPAVPRAPETETRNVPASGSNMVASRGVTPAVLGNHESTRNVIRKTEC